MKNNKGQTKLQQNILTSVKGPTVLPPEQSQTMQIPLNAIAQNAVVQQQKFHSGPLPAPEELIAYNKAIPDAAERIVAMTERQALHRQSIEAQIVKSQVRNSLFGILSALIICLTTVCIGGYCVYMGAGWPATILGASGLCGVCVTFIYGTRQQMQLQKQQQALVLPHQIAVQQPHKLEQQKQ